VPKLCTLGFYWLCLAFVGLLRAAGLAFLGFPRAPALSFLGFSGRRPWLLLAFPKRRTRRAKRRAATPSPVKRQQTSTFVNKHRSAPRRDAKKIRQNVSECQHPPRLRLPTHLQTQHREDAAGHASPPRYFTIEIHKSK
jgi:hypothetical protein